MFVLGWLRWFCVGRRLLLLLHSICSNRRPTDPPTLHPPTAHSYACFKRALKHDIKVAQLAGYVAEHSAYHHGEASLMGTIVGLAHDFVGTNNVNLLVPQGQFGTRLQGGRDAASPRYIFTRLAPLARHLFNEADDRLLAYQQDEGQAIEPAWYAPILPTVLVNGAEGIGTGWSTSVPNYSPRDLAANLKRMLDGGEPEPMTPWYV